MKKVHGSAAYYISRLRILTEEYKKSVFFMLYNRILKPESLVFNIKKGSLNIWKNLLKKKHKKG